MTELSSLLTVDRIRAMCPKVRDDILEAIITDGPTEFESAGLTDHVRVAHFMAQIATETGGLKRLDEDLHYKTAAQLRKVFPSKFKTDASAKPYLKQPEPLANYVYAKRNGNKLPDDGWRYRGSGLIQLTGRGNFEAVGKLLGMNLADDPDSVRLPDSALAIALGYWTKTKINAVAGDATEEAVKAVTKRINPKLLGLADRRAYFKKAMKAFAPPKSFPLAETLAEEVSPAGGMLEVPTPELSGPQWVARFPTSREITDLTQPFSGQVAAFVGALTQAGAKVRINASYRPKERAYLMHWSWKIARQNFNPSIVPPMPGLAITWIHPTLAKSRTAARQMVEAYGMAFIAALNSRHTERRAIDMTISWNGTLSIVDKNGAVRQIDTQPRNGGNTRLVKVGAAYGVIKLVSDPPHWSDDGR